MELFGNFFWFVFRTRERSFEEEKDPAARHCSTCSWRLIVIMKSFDLTLSRVSPLLLSFFAFHWMVSNYCDLPALDSLAARLLFANTLLWVHHCCGTTENIMNNRNTRLVELRIIWWLLWHLYSHFVNFQVRHVFSQALHKCRPPKAEVAPLRRQASDLNPRRHAQRKTSKINEQFRDYRMIDHH